MVNFEKLILKGMTDEELHMELEKRLALQMEHAREGNNMWSSIMDIRDELERRSKKA